ncbi:MAG: GxGYxYP domain-containing protein [Acidobacteriaceae bacterium]
MKRREFLFGSAASALALGMSPGDAMGQAPGQVSDSPICPKCPPPAKRLAVFDLRELTSHAADFRLTLACLQGIVNSRQPRLYLIQDHYDELWLDWMRERGDIESVENLGIAEVFARFVPEVGSMYITDPAIPASINVATMLAGLRSALVATPSIADQFNLSAGAYPDDEKIGGDFRRMYWKKDVDAYRWFFSNYGSQLGRGAVSILDPYSAVLRDYLVAFKIPIVWISSRADAARNPQADYDAEFAFVRELFLRWPPNIPCLGWPGNSVGPEAGIGEWDGIDLTSRCAKFEICSGYDGYSPAVSNTTVHSGTQATFQQHPAPIRLQRDKVYFAMIRSDGDGWNFQRRSYRQLFDDPHHGAVPIGWQIGPTAADAIPDILDYYYRHARPGDYFVNALTGVGYIRENNYADLYPQSQQEKILQDYVALSGRYRARIDSSVMSTYSEMSPERLKTLASIPGIRGVFANYGRTRATTADNLITVVDGKPVFRAVNPNLANRTFTLTGRREAVSSLVRTVRENTPRTRPFFLHVFLGNWLVTMDMAEEIVKQLGPRYVAVRPDQLVSLFQQSRKQS